MRQCPPGVRTAEICPARIHRLIVPTETRSSAAASLGVASSEITVLDIASSQTVPFLVNMTSPTDRIVLVLDLERLEVDENRGVARYRMSLESARQHAAGVLAAIDRLEPVEVVVRGSG
jgi:hypothetical protein